MKGLFSKSSSNHIKDNQTVTAFVITGNAPKQREMSARTKRAQKFSNAYLRSTGMGIYTPHVTKTSDKRHNKPWKS